VAVSRILALESVANVRDLGGLPAGDGSVVRRGRLVRSASLHEMTDSDRGVLERSGITAVIDLRAPYERHLHPTVWKGIRLVSAPLVHDAQVRSIVERFHRRDLTDAELLDWWTLTGVVDAPYEHLGSVGVIFETLLAAAPEDGFIFHCRGGKDRTGMVAALILEALGVPRPQILEDFLMSNAILDAERPTGDAAVIVSAVSGSELSPEAAFSFAGVRREWMERLWAGIETRDGSLLSYLTDTVGIGETGLAGLRSRYLEPPPPHR
jgi:protein-tyrosine phosphatase